MLGGWKRINSAPRDGRRILVFGNTKRGLRPMVAEFQNHPKWGEMWIALIVNSDECDIIHYMFVENPTHWMPLPAPPGRR